MQRWCDHVAVITVNKYVKDRNLIRLRSFIVREEVMLQLIVLARGVK